jgi:RimJ/RimL family protein N-acetyltransferase
MGDRETIIENKLITQRLLLAKLKDEDAAFMYQLVNTEEWIKNIGDRNIHSVPDAKKYIANLTSNPHFHIWTVKQSVDGEYLGIITYLKKEYLDYPDIGFAFLPHFFGKGYAFEATHKIMDMLIKSNIKHISAVTILENNRSIQLLKRLGFKEIKTIINSGEELLYFLYTAD